MLLHFYYFNYIYNYMSLLFNHLNDFTIFAIYKNILNF